MRTVTTPSQQGETVFISVSHSRSRILIMAIAFWHTLRRDIMVTSREFIPFLVQVLVQPFSLLLVFGKILPGVGTMQQLYPALFFPGVVGLTIFVASLQGITLALMFDLSYDREIDDRLLAPLPVSMVAVEKILFVSMRTLVAAAITFPMAYVVLGNGYAVRTDMIWPLIGLMVLYSLSSAALGLVIGAALPVDKSYLVFTLIVSATLYTGCVYYTWTGIGSIKALQIITLLNPLTYASEGFRYAMVPATAGQNLATLPIGWALVGLAASLVIFLFIGIRVFYSRVVS